MDGLSLFQRSGPKTDHFVRPFAALALIFLMAGCVVVRQDPVGIEPATEDPAPEIVESPSVPEAAEVPVDLAVTDATETEWIAGAADASEETAPEDEPAGEEEAFAGEELSESPLDDLAVITPEIDPQILEEEKAKAVDSAPTYDIPIVMNDKVMAWLDYYSKARERSFKPGLIRSGRYLPMIRRIYEEEGIPRDLGYMAHVESAYKTSAYSRARARGVFQFMTATAKTYGLKVDYWVDERLDPEKSARASARYLQKLYGDFGDWYLALAAYNAGEGKIRRALARSGKRDFWGIAETRHIRRETKNHVPAILAATIISKDPEAYGFFFEPDEAIVYDTIQVSGAADLRVLAECAGSDVATMKLLNPALRRGQTPPSTKTDVRVPVGTAERTLTALAEIPRNERVLYARHKVKRGDSLSTIARAYGVSIYGIQQANRMGRRTLIRAGQTLVIPTSNRAATYGATPPVDRTASSEAITYRVRRGDTLYAIARRYGTTPASIAAASGIRANKLLQIGERLTVVPGVRSVSKAARIANGHTKVHSGVTTHTVRRGENLWRIASRYRTTVAALCEANQISPQSTLYPGTRLVVRK